MKQVVVDASFCGAWILSDESSKEAERLLMSAMRGEVKISVPALWHYEMNNLLHSALRRKRLTLDDAQSSLAALEQTPIFLEDVPTASVQKRILHLALQFEISSYDAAYLELADRHKMILYSFDKKLCTAASLLGLSK